MARNRLTPPWGPKSVEKTIDQVKSTTALLINYNSMVIVNPIYVCFISWVPLTTLLRYIRPIIATLMSQNHFVADPKPSV